MQKPMQIQVEKALNSLENIQTASPVAFFYTRVVAALNKREKNFYEKMSAIITKPAIVIVGISLILLLNAMAIFDQKTSIQSTANQSEQLDADEYNIAVNSYYQYENPDQ